MKSFIYACQRILYIYMVGGVQGCLGCVWEMLGVFGESVGRCLGGVWACLGMFERCLAGVWVMFRWCFGDIWGMFGGCLGNVCKILNGVCGCLGWYWGELAQWIFPMFEKYANSLERMHSAQHHPNNPQTSFNTLHTSPKHLRNITRATKLACRSTSISWRAESGDGGFTCQ